MDSGRMNADRDTVAFFRAVEQGDTAELKALLDAGQDPNTVREVHETVPTGKVLYPVYEERIQRQSGLEAACKAGQHAAATLLLTRGANATGTALWHAVEQGDAELVHRLLELGADPDPIELVYEQKTLYHPAMHEYEMYWTEEVHEWRPCSPLIRAAEHKRPDLIGLLLAHGAARADLVVLLQAAGAGGGAEMVRALLERADFTTNDLNTALNTAASGGQEKTVDLLLELGADIAACGNAALSNAAYHGHSAVAERLLQARVIPQADDLRRAAQNGHTRLLARLLEASPLEIDAEVGERGERYFATTPLMAAALGGHTDTVRYLLDRGADPRHASPQGQETALTLAAYAGHTEVVLLLLNRYDPSPEESAKALREAAARGDDEGTIVQRLLGEQVVSTELLQAAARTGRAANLRLLLKRFPEPRVAAIAVALETAVTAVAGDAIPVLLDAGGDIEQQDKRGRTLLLQAVSDRHKNVARILLERGADPEARDATGRTALHVVADGITLPAAPSETYLELLILLHAYHADVNARDDTGRTPLMALVSSAWVPELTRRTVRWLLRFGADPRARDAQGRTARDYAAADRAAFMVAELAAAEAGKS